MKNCFPRQHRHLPHLPDFSSTSREFLQRDLGVWWGFFLLFLYISLSQRLLPNRIMVRKLLKVQIIKVKYQKSSFQRESEEESWFTTGISLISKSAIKVQLSCSPTSRKLQVCKEKAPCKYKASLKLSVTMNEEMDVTPVTCNYDTVDPSQSLHTTTSATMTSKGMQIVSNVVFSALRLQFNLLWLT